MDNTTIEINNKLAEILKTPHNIINIPLYTDIKNKKNTLVLSGGGIKGICFIGALQALQELNILNNIKIFAGTSVGSIVCFLIIIGYTPEELYEFIKIFDFSKVNIMNFEILINEFGLNDGLQIIRILSSFLTKKKYNINVTLKELYDITQKEFIITTTNINKKCCEYLSYKTYPDLCVLQAIKMSISMPIIFTPVKFNNNMYVDGGCTDDLPMEIFEDQSKVLGLYLDEKVGDNLNINSFEAYGLNIIKSMITKRNINKENTVIIYTQNIKTVSFDININKKEEMYKTGYDSTNNFFKPFMYAKYN